MTHRILFALLPILLIASIVLTMAGEAVAARNMYDRSTIDDKKQPQWFIGYDGVSVLIPGIGRVTLPPYKKGSSGRYSGSYGSGTGPSPRYIPGGDDTFVPNPGFEVPNPASIGVEATPYP